jgi:hypothetical protein
MLVARFLDGLSGSAFLSVAAGSVADLFLPRHIQFPMMLYTVCPFIGQFISSMI